jgi:4-diphosphocytidyl-2-C-methyl-D-erythritol kinase
MQAESITITAGCKVNLYLRILGRRNDGYHEIHTLFYPLPEPCDMLEIRRGQPGSGLTLSCTLPGLSGRRNILFQAYERFARATGWQPDLSIVLRKNIPIGAGLGGGSSDAAALLNHLNRCAGARALGKSELFALATSLGADVPFFLSNVPALAGGIGEIIEPVPIDLSSYSMLLLCPPVHISTTEAYRAWDLVNPSNPDFLTSQRSMGRKPFCISKIVLCNSFEPAVFPLFPILRELKMAMLGFGAAGCVLSGSGSSLYALFRDEEQREEAGSWLQGRGIPLFSHDLRRWGVAKR